MRKKIIAGIVVMLVIIASLTLAYMLSLCPPIPEGIEQQSQGLP